MRKLFLSIGAFSALIAVSLMLMGASPATYKDGIYFIQGDDFEKGSGWKDLVTIEVKAGQIVKAEWDGVNSEVPVFKPAWVKAGKYVMKKDGVSWAEQAEKVTSYLVKTQDPSKMKFSDAEGHTDAIAGVSIHVKPFFVLAQKALAAGPTPRGAYKDGIYHAEAADFDAKSGWKGTIDVLVKHGYIVNACWNALAKDGTDKFAAIKAGKYVMKDKGVPWNAQARDTVRYLLKSQDPTKIVYKDVTGLTDAITGVSIHVKEFFELAKEALKKAK